MRADGEFLYLMAGGQVHHTFPLEAVSVSAAGAMLSIARDGAVQASIEVQGFLASRTAGQVAKTVNQASTARRVAIQAANQRESQQAIAQASNILGIFPRHLPHGPDWYTCSACGAREEILAGSAAKVREIAALFRDHIDGWAIVVQKTGVWDLNGLGPYQGQVYPSDLQTGAGLNAADAAAKLTIAAALGLLTPFGAGYRWAWPLCAGCYTRLSDQLVMASEQSAQVPDAPSPARDPIPAQLRFRVLQRDSFRCRYCGRSASDGAQLHVDHVVPVAHGGETTEENLMTACSDCNLGKSTSEVV